MAADETPSPARGGAFGERRGEPRPRREDRFYLSCAASAVNPPGNARGEGDLPWRHISMVEMEMDAAIVLANFAQIAFQEREGGGERGTSAQDAGSTQGAEYGPLAADAVRGAHRSERGDSMFHPSSSRRAQRSSGRENQPPGEDCKRPEASGTDPGNALGLDQTPGCPSSNISFCRGKRNLTEAEKEAKRLRRVLANRQSARQTIFRRQARLEELAKRAAELSLENEKIKLERALLVEEYSSLRDANSRLREQVMMIERASLNSKSTGDLAEEMQHLAWEGGPRSEMNAKIESEEVQPEGWRGCCHYLGKTADAWAETMACKRRKELAGQGWRG